MVHTIKANASPQYELDDRVRSSANLHCQVCSPAPSAFPVEEWRARLRAFHFPAVPDAGWSKPNAEWRTAWAEETAKREELDAADYRRRLMKAPGWWADLEFVHNLALEFLPLVVAKLDYDLVCGMWNPGQVRWWPLHEPGWVLAVAKSGTSRPIVCIDRASGWWIVGQWERQGPNLVDLAAWRWGLSRTKAAWRLAKLCGLRRPVR